MDLYFARHDGQAVTCDEFLAAMADANDADLSALAKWCAGGWGGCSRGGADLSALAKWGAGGWGGCSREGNAYVCVWGGAVAKSSIGAVAVAVGPS